MRVEIDSPVAGDPHAAPLRQAMVHTAALDLIDRARDREPSRSLNHASVGVSTTMLDPDHPSGVMDESMGGLNRQAAAHPPVHTIRRPSPMLVDVIPRPLTPADHLPVSGTTLHARSPERAEPTSTGDLWAMPTSDLAALVAQVLAQLSEVRPEG